MYVSVIFQDGFVDHNVVTHKGEPSRASQPASQPHADDSDPDRNLNQALENDGDGANKRVDPRAHRCDESPSG